MSVNHIQEKVRNQIELYLDYLRGTFTQVHGTITVFLTQTGTMLQTYSSTQIQKVITLLDRFKGMGESLTALFTKIFNAVRHPFFTLATYIVQKEHKRYNEQQRSKSS